MSAVLEWLREYGVAVEHEGRRTHTSISWRGREAKFDLLCTNRWLLSCQNKNYIYEPEVTAAICYFVHEGDFCIDAGAEIGFHSLSMSRLVGQSGEVWAFEPDPYCFSKLSANIKINDATNVRAIPVALWDRSEYRDFFFGEDFSGYSGFGEYKHFPMTNIKLQTLPLDDIIDSNRRVRILKIDCEGSEEKILHGAEKLLLRGVDCVIAEFNYSIMPAYGSGDKSIRDYMSSLGYDFFFIQDGSSLPVFVPPDANIVVQGTEVHLNGMFSKSDLLKEWLNPGYRHAS